MPVRPIPAGSPASGTTATTTTSLCWRRPASAPRTLTCLGTRCPPQSSSLPCPRQTRACCPLARSRRGIRAPLPPPPPHVAAPPPSRPLRLRAAHPLHAAPRHLPDTLTPLQRLLLHNGHLPARWL